VTSPLHRFVWSWFGLVFLALVAAVLLLDNASQAASKLDPAATVAAKAWLGLVDDAKYGESWDEAARLFRGAVTRDDWSAKAAAVRGPLGKVISRRVKSARAATSLPGAPDGQYVVIQFATSFEHKKAAIETVTPLREADGAWKVSGYFIK